MRARTTWLLAPLVAAVLAAAGCSSSADGSAASDGGSASGGAHSPIVIGNLGEYSGPLPLADAKAGVQAWADAVNASGGIDGHPVKLYVEDTGGNSAMALTAAKTLIDSDHVVAIVGMTDDGTAWASYADSKGIPVVGGGLTAAVPFLTDPNFFSVGGNILSSFYGVASETRKLGPKTALVYCAETPTCHAAATIEQALGQPLGLSLSYSAGVLASVSDFTAQCQAMKDSGAASWTPGLSITVAARLAAQCEQEGFTGKLIWPLGTSASSSTSITAFDGSEYVDSTIGFFVDSTPATKAFHAALAKYEPSVGSAALPLKGTAVAAWASGELLEAAVKASGEPDVTPASIKKGLYALKNDTLGGLVPPLNFKPGQVNLHNCYFTYMLQAGGYVEPDLQPSCVNASADALIGKIAASLKS